MNINLRFYIAPMALAAGALFTSCLGTGDETIPLEFDKNVVLFPSDDEAQPNPSVVASDSVPNINDAVVVDDAGDMVAQIYMPGIKYPDSDQYLHLQGTPVSTTSAIQNVWVSVDGTPKGCKALNNSENDIEGMLAVDLVFLVDNSSNMNEVGDMISADMKAWAAGLEKSNLDVRYASVGYGGGDEAKKGVDGAIDLTDEFSFRNYLTREDCKGVSRTKGYGGANAELLQTKSVENYSNCEGECAVEALRYANEMFSFRKGANRVYINFTDEANQPGGSDSWSVNYVLNQQRWQPYKGSVHTVFSGNPAFDEQEFTYEWPWRLSRYTGGTEYFCDGKLTDVKLDYLPVSGALKNFYIIQFKNVGAYMDGKSHKVNITVRSADGKIQANKVFDVVFKKN